MIVFKLSELWSTSDMLSGVVYLSAPPSYETIAENRGEGASKVSGRPIYDRPIVRQRTLIRFNGALKRIRYTFPNLQDNRVC